MGIRAGVAFLTLSLLFSGVAYGVENTQAIYSDVTQKRYERKAALSVGELVFSSTTVTVPVVDNTKKGTASFIAGLVRAATGQNAYTYKVSKNQIDDLTKLFYKYVITQRFDKILLLPDKAVIITKTGEMVADTGLPSPGIPQEISYSDFKNRVESYLNSKVAPVVGQLLSASMDQRYKELPEKEQMTFITQKAKELGITADVADKLMNSGFAFATYIPSVSGVLTLNVSSGLDKILVAGAPYNAKMTLEMKPKVIIYKFNPGTGKFEFYKEIKAESGKTTEIMPLTSIVYGAQYYKNLFDKAISTTAKAAALNAGMKLKEDDNFAVFAPAEEVSGSTFKAAVGVAEAIRVDAPFDVYEFKDGEKVYKGFGKTRKVAANCDENSIDKTELTLIKGNVEEYDLLREHPWSGVLIGLQAGFTPFTVSEVAGYPADGGGTWSTIRLRFDADLGYIRNSKALSEWWLKVYTGIGFGADDVTVDMGWLGTLQLSPDAYYEGGFGVYKRFYLGTTGLSIAPGADISGRYLKFTGTWGDELTISALTLTPNIGFVYSFSPNFEINGEVGYALDVYSSTTLTDIWGNQYTGSATTEGGVNGFIGFSFHFGAVGSFAKLYSEPPKCEKAK
ncbi:hypothetical protein [Desulfurobacterium atlanticum]|uniref:Uncharacterized protein n=1 Tax=Desulfurobacterium atlanticum TaxID=240169 RepID=A0A238YWU8_9BACT|nr:hypothetical protein [Desulfurobacterium atlanticum]SNR75605.1 hypothetical protein SAMN06265340_10572 [Desulfurobacterium atlanticum]